MSRAHNIAKILGHVDEPATEATHQPLLTLVCSACQAGPFSYEGFRQAVVSGRNTDSMGYCYQTSWAEISRSISTEDCTWCQIVKRTKDGLPTDRLASVGTDTVEVRFQVSVKYTPQEFNYVKIYLDGFLATDYRMELYADEDDALDIDMKTEETSLLWPWVDQRTDYYTKALECINECSKHEYCPTVEERYLPTRVIDCLDPSKPRLIDTQRKIRGYYCALSYVWGGAQPQKTTTSNIKTYTSGGINVPLPRTIANAIIVTNKLGIPYLWVDALCIIQDSSEDKARELGIMAHIYRDAYLTISVNSAYSADEGFLPGERKPDVLPFYLKDQSKPPGWMLLKGGVQFPGRLLRQLGLANAKHNPLDKRAWCLQESILSPRRLIFQPPKVLYKCRSFTEHQINGEPNHSPSPVDDHILFPSPKHRGLVVSEKQYHQKWWDILRDYSRREITLPSDKLVAVASIAEVLQTHLQDQYIAGLWRRNLLENLLWKIRPPMGPDEAHLPRPIAYRAPTWSWASVDGELVPPHSQFSQRRPFYEAELQECKVTPNFSAYPFGEVSDARLIFRAKIRPLMNDGRKCSFVAHPGARLPSGGLGHWQWTPPTGNTLEPVYLNTASDRKTIGGITFDCLEGTEQDRYTDFYVLVLRAGRKWEDHGHWLEGLLVLKDDIEVEEYRKVATFDFHYSVGWLDWLDCEPLKTVSLV